MKKLTPQQRQRRAELKRQCPICHEAFISRKAKREHRKVNAECSPKEPVAMSESSYKALNLEAPVTKYF